MSVIIRGIIVMTNRTFNRITKTITFLLALCSVLSVTAASVSAATLEQGNKSCGHEDKYKDSDSYGQGYNDGHGKGYIDGKKDCSQYGRKNILRKIPGHSNNEKSYCKGFLLGYKAGYNEKRYTCLKKYGSAENLSISDVRRQ